MNIAVFVKHVPDTAEADISIAGEGKSIKTAGLPFQMNEWDRFALEEAVKLKEAGGGTITAFLAGPEEHEESLRRCLAVGADRAVRVDVSAIEGRGPADLAAALYKAVGGERFDLCLFGSQASDDGYGVVGPFFAELSGLPSATLVNAMKIEGGALIVTRELEGGVGEVARVEMPAVITIQTGINEPRYVSILGIKKARAKPIDLVGAGAAEADQVFSVAGLEAPPEGGQAELWSGTIEEIAAKFVNAVSAAGGVK